MVRTESTANIATERGSRYTERVGAAKCGGIGEQPRLMPGIQQAAAEHGERSHIALGAIRYDDKFHEPWHPSTMREISRND